VNESRVEAIKSRLRVALEPELLEVEDESHLHEGHVGARDGRGHFRVTIVSEHFASLSRIGRHRLVYDTLGELMQTDIHALTIQAIAPSEF
jgi:BolA family transcriptional regulator, general stress-responsive regulator